MLNRIKNLISKIAQLKPTFDPGFIDDDLAQQVDWKALKGGGASFRTRKLVHLNPSRIEWVSSFGMRLFAAAFSVPAFVILFVMIFGSQFNEAFIENKVLLLIPLFFLLASLVMWYFIMIPIVFDKRAGYFWKGWNMPQHQINVQGKKNIAKIKQIYAIQILPERISSDKGSYISYELNLIMKDTTRLNVVDHGDYPRLISDSEILADFLEVPIWDAVQRRSRPKIVDDQLDLI